MKSKSIIIVGIIGCILNIILYVVLKDIVYFIAAGVALIVIQNQYIYLNLSKEAHGRILH